jgi:hypothetical protein
MLAPNKQMRKLLSRKWACWFSMIAVLVLGSPILLADGPAAADDLAVTPQDQPVSISVLANDSDAPTNQLAILQVTAPSHGMVTINTNGVVTNAELFSLVAFAGVQLSNTVRQLGLKNTNMYPRATMTNGLWTTTPVDDNNWTTGFFPGALWYERELTGDTNYGFWAQKWMQGIAPEQFSTNTDDVGYMINTSFGNGYRLTGIPSYKNILVRTANSFSNRFNGVVGVLADDRLLAPPEFETILDTMLNTEILYDAVPLGGSSNLFTMAYSHALRAATNQVRTNPFGSTFQLAQYYTTNGALNYLGTRGGASQTSCWARAQSWGIYGFTMAYGNTHDLRLLDAAQHTADFYFDTNTLPSDYVPYWDFFAPGIPTNAPRDSSTAAITLSALLQLSQLVTNYADGARYWLGAHHILTSLGSTNYLAQGTHESGILLHGTGEPPQFGSPEVDVCLIYGDYYFLEALKRYTDLYRQTTVTYTPSPGFSGNDSFTYQMCDSAGLCSTASVTVVVQSTNAPPSVTAQISLDPASGVPTVAFPTVSGRLYSVQYKSDLSTPGSWTTLVTNVVGSNTVQSYADTNAPASDRVYRVVVR